eukprot:6053803-Alexandrium_andersonii.AAC.1
MLNLVELTVCRLCVVGCGLRVAGCGPRVAGLSPVCDYTLRPIASASASGLSGAWLSCVALHRVVL